MKSVVAIVIATLLWGLCLPTRAEGIVRIDRLDHAAPVPVATIAGLPASAFVATAHPDRIGMPGQSRGWWRIESVRPGESGALWVYHSFGARITVLAPPDYRPATLTVFDRDLHRGHSRRALAFPIRASGPIYVGVDDMRYPLRVEVRSYADFAIEDFGHMRRLWLCCGVVFAVALVVAVFWLQLSDRVYGLFSLNLVLQTLYILCTYGEAYAVPGLDGLATLGVTGQRWLVTASIIVGALFLIDFAELRPYAPRMAQALMATAVWFPSGLAVVLASPWPLDKPWYPQLANASLMISNALSLMVLTAAWRGGGRYAGYVLLGWVPLMAMTAARVVQIGMGQPLSPWLEDALPVMTAVSAVILMMGLADRMKRYRRDRDAAKRHAQYDSLTGVLNRYGILHALEEAIAETRRRGYPLSLLFLDVDHFKSINDRYGHAVGDACLRALTECIQSGAMPAHRLGRIGGEEFLLLLPGSPDWLARETGEHIRRRVEQVCRSIADAPVAMTLSVGVVQWRDGEDAAGAIERADAAMYRAKSDGRNRVVVLGESL
ncbi:MAG: sensor domain-containing diguanylate cyclase [Lysobacter sp.]